MTGIYGRLANRMRRGLLIFGHDLFMVPVAWLGSYWFRFNLAEIPDAYWAQATRTLPWVMLVQTMSFYRFDLHKGVWRFSSLPDLIRTAVEFTVETVARACEEYLPSGGAGSGDREMIVAGGGTRNPVVMERLAERLAPLPMRVSDELGMPADAREAAAFAILADAFLHGIPANVPAVTGAARPVVLGSLVPGSGRPLISGTGGE